MGVKDVGYNPGLIHRLAPQPAPCTGTRPSRPRAPPVATDHCDDQQHLIN
jgi:hypothetical protein